MNKITKNAWFRNSLPALCALPAALVGCIAMKLHGLPAITAFQNLAVLLAGGIVSFVCMRNTKPIRNFVRYVLLAVGLFAMGAVFLFPGAEGIHRWVYIGPLALHTVLIVLPVVLICLYSFVREGRLWQVLAMCVITAILLFLQKDASMLTAFALAVLPLVCTSRDAKPAHWGVMLALVVLALVSWWIHPMLAPEAHVEGIVGLAMQLSPVLGILAVASIALLFVPFAAGLKSSAHRPFLLACVLYYVGWLLSCVIGAFPVPVLGYGASSVIGYMVLATAARKKSEG